MAWVCAVLGAGLVAVAELADLPRWAVFGVVGVVLLAIGLVQRRPMTVPQALALVGYFGLAVVTVLLSPAVGLAIAGIVLALHAVWDVVHYRRNIVVDRALALWCIGLDLFLGGACVVLAVVGVG